MTIDQSVNGLLEGGGKALSFDGQPPILHKGTVIAATTSQQTDPSGNPKTFDNGDPMMQIVITLQTDYRDDPTDDGVRRLFVKSGALKALRDALRAAGGVGLEVGGQLAMQYHADGEATKRGFNPPKLYRAQYQPPAPTAAANDLLGASPPAGPTAASWAQDGGVLPPAAPAKVDPFDAGVDFLNS